MARQARGLMFFQDLSISKLLIEEKRALSILTSITLDVYEHMSEVCAEPARLIARNSVFSTYL